MSSINQNFTLKNAYLDLNNTINEINRKITFHNIKSVCKIYSIMTIIFATGYFVAQAFVGLPILSIFFASALYLYINSSSFGDAVKQDLKMSRAITSGEIKAIFNNKISKFSSVIQKSLKANIEGLDIMSIWKLTLHNPTYGIISKLKLGSFASIQKSFEKYNSWFPCLYKSA